MKVMAILVHGYNVWDGGQATVGKLQSFLEVRGVDCIVLNYGWTGLIGTYKHNSSIAARIGKAAHAARLAGYTVIAFGHSNGCAILHMATTRFSAYIPFMTYVNPALGKTMHPGRNVESLHVWHSPSDAPVRWAKYLPFHPWGEMGATGYTGDDKRVTNFDKQYGYPVSSREHSDMFLVEGLPFFGPLCVDTRLDSIPPTRK